jgi:ascorbate-specific PTS system EIIC-type component UlaA
VTPQARKTIAVLCIALVLVAGVLPAVSVALASVILVALWLVAPAVVVTVVRRIASDSEEQPVSLLALLDSRGPPRLVALR